jgi:hypothetical protein
MDELMEQARLKDTKTETGQGKVAALLLDQAANLSHDCKTNKQTINFCPLLSLPVCPGVEEDLDEDPPEDDEDMDPEELQYQQIMQQDDGLSCKVGSGKGKPSKETKPPKVLKLKDLANVTPTLQQGGTPLRLRGPPTTPSTVGSSTGSVSTEKDSTAARSLDFEVHCQDLPDQSPVLALRCTDRAVNAAWEKKVAAVQTGCQPWVFICSALDKQAQS